LISRASPLLVALFLLISGCSDSADPDEWGAPAEEFFAAWSDAWSGSDAYDIIRFYDADVHVGRAQDYRTLSLSASFKGTSVAGDGRAWLVDWIEAQYESRARTLHGLYLSERAAIVVVVVDEIETASAVVMAMDDDLIESYTDLRWRDAHLAGGMPDARMDWLDGLVTDDLASLPEGELVTLQVGGRAGPAVFVGDSVAVYLARVGGDCSGEYAFVLDLEEDLAAPTAMLPTADTLRRCDPDRAAADAWWNTIEVPLPIGQQVTGVIPQRDGTEISVFNGTDELEGLLTWGLSRYEDAGLVPPELVSASFAPLRVCSDLQGVVTDAGEGASDLVLCTDAYRACEPDREMCTSFASGDRLAMLHELAHAWLLQNLGAADEAAFLEVRGLDTWVDGSVAWHERGVEQAAEILAWGLMDEDVELLRIGETSCAVAAVAFRLLTGVAPMRTCG